MDQSTGQSLAVDPGAPAVAQAAPAPAPVAPAPAPAATPPMPASPQMDAGMQPPQKQEGWNEFFKELNWVEMGFLILGAAGLYYTIYYYRYKLREDKVSNMDMQRQIDELKMNVQPALKGKYKTL